MKKADMYMDPGMRGDWEKLNNPKDIITEAIGRILPSR
jgi:hypothetical protein